MEESILKLGGNIELSGFSELDGSTMVILKKIVGNYAKRMSTKTENFERLALTMKKVHNSQFEITAKLHDNGKLFNSETTDRNLFVAVDNALKKLMNEYGMI